MEKLGLKLIPAFFPKVIDFILLTNGKGWRRTQTSAEFGVPNFAGNFVTFFAFSHICTSAPTFVFDKFLKKYTISWPLDVKEQDKCMDLNLYIIKPKSNLNTWVSNWILIVRLKFRSGSCCFYCQCCQLLWKFLAGLFISCHPPTFWICSELPESHFFLIHCSHWDFI